MLRLDAMPEFTLQLSLDAFRAHALAALGSPAGRQCAVFLVVKLILQLPAYEGKIHLLR